METSQQKVDRLQAELDALNAQSPRNDAAVNQTSIALDEAKREMEQEQAAQVRIQDATEQAAYFLDNLVIEELTMRELCVGEEQYQMLRIAVQNKIINVTEEASNLVSEVQASENAQQFALKQQVTELQGIIESGKASTSTLTQENDSLKTALSQSQLETADYQGKLKNATDEIERLNSHVDDLRKEIAVGARNAYKVTDVEQSAQLKELADKIKASRIHVYDVEPDSEINPKNYTAKRVDNGGSVTWNWTQAKNYIEIKDPNEVEQFRQQFANQEAVSDIPLDQPVQDNVTPEVPFLELPRAEAPEVNIPAEVQLAVSAPTDGGQGQTVEERVAALEKRVIELEKVCNLNEEAA